MDTNCKSYAPYRTPCKTSCKNSKCTSCHCDAQTLKNICDFEGITPAILPMPFPDVQVQCKNKYYAHLLNQDYCGMTSELTAITQYVNHEIRLSGKHCETARTLLSIAQAEMIHLQKLGELIVLLGQPLTYNDCEKDHTKVWTADSITLGTNYHSIICSDIEGEYGAIKQYEKHISKIDDPYIKAMLKRIAMDEHYHISLLKKCLKK